MNTSITTVEVTQGSNGYPSGLYNVIVADTMSELKELQAAHGGELITISKKNGWQLWQNNGTFFGDSLLGMPASDSDTVIRYRKGEDIGQIAFDFVIGDYKSATQALADIYPDATIDEAMEALKAWKERMEEITDAITEGEDCDIWLSNPNPSDGIDFTVDAESVSYHSDVTTTRIALKVEI